ncbi:hypothetical protein EK21DRAFT_111629 [Setomelanomma holmii]|uniref:Uncharacterized protein n=1 Tax=Setomelanomma holmii TaxID=210430 RepID=A0A9P4H9W6_9PLEO|nr:hypothetical protein EK21DRAFT_111629 [Setomelanomma holmii]
MRITILVAALVAFASAAPYPQDQEEPDDAETISAPFATPTTPIPLTTSLNIPVTSSLELPTPISDTHPEDPDATTTKRNPHREPISIFTKQCRCNYEENFSYGCYMSAAGGCPTPTRTCKNLFTPSPRPGRHPCELGPNPPLNTSVPEISTLLPTLNVSVPIGPSGNVTVPVVTIGV